MDTVTSLPWWVLTPASLALVSGSSLILRALLVRIVGPDRAQAAGHAAPLMPALGVLFAFMTGFAVTAMWTAHTNAETIVSREATAGSTLAWAATAPGADTTSIQSVLRSRLDQIIDDGPDRPDGGSTSGGSVSEEMADLERVVRVSASNPTMSQADAAELLTALDAFAVHASDHLGAESRSMPLPLFAALVISGLAACLNALAIALNGTRRSSWITTTILIVVAVDLAVLLVLAGPFTGSQQVSDAPLVAVRDQIAADVHTR